MRLRLGELWQIAYVRHDEGPIVLVVHSDPSTHLHHCLVIENSAFGWLEGEVKLIGDWHDTNGWKRLA